MTKADDRIEDLKEVVGNINNRLTNCENILSKTREEKLASDLEQYKMITCAVSEAIKPLLDKMTQQEDRITVLENAEGKRALERQNENAKTIKAVLITVVVTFFASIILNNLIVVISSSIDKVDNQVIEEAK